jgi:phage shock protein C
MKNNLYRDPLNGKLTGVCAGIANYLGAEYWVVRILVVSATLLGGGFVVVLAYLALTFMLEKQEGIDPKKLKNQQAHKVKSKAWQSGQSPTSILSTIEDEIYSIECGVKRMEAYVTSDTYKVNKEFRNL